MKNEAVKNVNVTKTALKWASHCHWASRNSLSMLGSCSSTTHICVFPLTILTASTKWSKQERLPESLPPPGTKIVIYLNIYLTGMHGQFTLVCVCYLPLNHLQHRATCSLWQIIKWWCGRRRRRRRTHALSRKAHYNSDFRLLKQVSSPATSLVFKFSNRCWGK